MTWLSYWIGTFQIPPTRVPAGALTLGLEVAVDKIFIVRACVWADITWHHGCRRHQPPPPCCQDWEKYKEIICIADKQSWSKDSAVGLPLVLRLQQCQDGKRYNLNLNIASKDLLLKLKTLSSYPGINIFPVPGSWRRPPWWRCVGVGTSLGRHTLEKVGTLGREMDLDHTADPRTAQPLLGWSSTVIIIALCGVIILSVSSSAWNCTFFSRFGHLLLTCLLIVLNAACRTSCTT